jgi:hypothetical protein
MLRVQSKRVVQPVIGTKKTVLRLIDKVCDLLPVATATPKFDHL